MKELINAVILVYEPLRIIKMPIGRCILDKVKLVHYENTPIQMYWKFHHKKWKFLSKKNLIFFIFLLKNIDYGYSLEPPRRGGSNEYPQSFLSRNKKKMYTPVNPNFTI